MKISLIFGVIHMAFGVMISVWNKVNKRQYHSIILEFLPQIIFLLFLFGYLIVMIFIKWVLYGANYTGQWSEHCAPNLLITFINMMLFKNDPPDPTQNSAMLMVSTMMSSCLGFNINCRCFWWLLES
eukprot:TRINITY_DN18411_c0_g1_i1.p1 TRINITY_DN18411_c0_g1~~TRINITY_DN18411_c0_g1_i1.p1  ORF type:complete len:127 (+),score=13.90 TRINITY_DN18411_c0_g1_i1:111-491(+)